jgi:hypothetical protein
MRIFYSGNEQKFPPEKMIENPNVMLSYAFLRKKKNDMGSKKRLDQILTNGFSAKSLFIDSGAFSLYTKQAEKGKNMKFFSLKAGSDFRRYCDRYGQFITKIVMHPILAAAVDVIYDPIKTHDTFHYMRLEYGLNDLVPVVHFGSDLKWIGGYLDMECPLIGLGGFAWGGDGTERWLNKCFEKYPGVKFHGFALTGWDSITRWPWASVDSTSWILTAAFGGIFIPQRKDGKWVYDSPPYVVSISDKAGSSKMRFQTMSPGKKKVVLDWLELNSLTWEEVSGKDNEKGKDPSYGLRAHLNLIYFENLQLNMPNRPQRKSIPGLI